MTSQSHSQLPGRLRDVLAGAALGAGKRGWVRYGVAAAIVVAATLLRLGCLQVLGTRATYVTLYPAVTLAAIYGGLRAGLLATILSAIVADYFWLEPPGFGISDPADWLSMAIFLASGTMISCVAEAMHRAQARARAAEAEAGLAVARQREGEVLRQARDELEVRVQERTEELAQTTEALRFERQRFRDVLDVLPAYVVLLTSDYYVPFANRFFEQRFGVSNGRRCYEYLFGRTEPCETCETYTALKTLAPHQWEWTGPDGRNYDIYDFPFTDTDGSSLILEMGIDITERKQAEAELEKHRHHLEELVQERTGQLAAAHAQIEAVVRHLDEGVVVADLEGHLLQWNPAAIAMHGFAGLEEARRRLVEFTGVFELSTMDGTVLPVDQWPLARILRGENLRDWEVRIRRLEGDWQRVFSYGGTLVRDAQGEPLLALVTVSDITERKRAEQALRESEEDLRRAQAVAQVGSWRLDVRRDDLRWSEQTHRMFGIPPGTRLTYEAFLAAVHPDDRRHVDEKWRAAMRGGLYDIEHRIVVGGAVKWVRERAELELDPQGRLLGGFGTVQDITERKRAEEQLRRAAEELARSNKDLEQFAYVASHDLQEPLRMVIGFVQLLQKKYGSRLDADADQYIEYAVDGAKRMQTLISDLLAFSRVNTQGEEFQDVDSMEAFNSAMKILGSAIGESGAVVTHGPLPVVRADKAQLARLFQNLVGNAIKYRCPDRPAEIHVSARQEPTQWTFSVRDNGIGFEQRYEDKIFMVFQRLHGRGKYPGTGIGLAICKRIVERHGGRIWATGEPGRGSVFYFTIPG